MGDLTADFSRSEFACKCGCGRNNISMELVQKLQQLRNITHMRIDINSGCRCVKHNADVGGEYDSAHICEGKEGEAADIAIHDPISRWAFVSAIFTYSLFKRIGIGKGLIHVDVSKTLPTPAIWPYPNK